MTAPDASHGRPDPASAASAVRVIDLRERTLLQRWRAWARQADRRTLEGAAANAASALARPRRHSDDHVVVVAQLEALDAVR